MRLGYRRVSSVLRWPSKRRGEGNGGEAVGSGLRDLCEPRQDALKHACWNAQGSIDTPTSSRKANHDHARLIGEQPTDGVVIHLQTLGDLRYGQKSFVDAGSRLDGHRLLPGSRLRGCAHI